MSCTFSIAYWTESAPIKASSTTSSWQREDLHLGTVRHLSFDMVAIIIGELNKSKVIIQTTLENDHTGSQHVF